MADFPLTIESMFREVISKIDNVTSQIGTIHVDHANLRGDLTKQVLELTNAFDQKLILAERRIEEKFDARKEKVDTWFEKQEDEHSRYKLKQEEELSKYKLQVEKKMTTITVKVGVIFSLVTAALVTLVSLLIRFAFHAPIGQ